MSVDYEIYMDGLRDKYLHLQEVYSGTSQEATLDETYTTLAFIPVVLASKVSAEMRSLALREYSEMMGAFRDMSLGLLGRNGFYEHAAEIAGKEATHYDDLRAKSAKKFQVLKEYLDSDQQDAIAEVEQEYELFKTQLALVIKSTLEIPEDQVVGPREVLEYLALQNTFNA
jgi:hypothetical protein